MQIKAGQLRFRVSDVCQTWLPSHDLMLYRLYVRGPKEGYTSLCCPTQLSTYFSVPFFLWYILIMALFHRMISASIESIPLTFFAFPLGLSHESESWIWYPLLFLHSPPLRFQASWGDARKWREDDKLVRKSPSLCPHCVRWDILNKHGIF